MMTVYNVGEDSLTETMSNGGRNFPYAPALSGSSPSFHRRMNGSSASPWGSNSRAGNILLARTLALLQRVTFFTHVSQEVRAWTITEGADAAAAAGSIHSDMERGFIRAEVVPFDDMIACDTIVEARRRGVLRAEGRRYQVQDGDVITFLFNV